LDSRYCRNPDGDFTIWCYTSEKEWEYCEPKEAMDVLLVRDPHGETTYSSKWNHNDPAWDDELVK
jgi:hypothetical protein